MPSFAIGDIVRVVRQPDDMLPHIVGEVGYIDQMNDTHAGFNGLKLDGSMSGCGGVKLDCLELETSPHWRKAKEIRDENSARTLAEGLARGSRRDARMAELSSTYGISVEDIKALQSDLRTLSDRDWWPE